MSQTYMDNIEVAAHDECVIKYNHMLNILGQLSNVPAVQLNNVPRNENLTFMMTNEYDEILTVT
jgi:hypothetical protein